MHSNASISSAIIETDFICDTVLSLLPRSTGGGGGQSNESIIKEKISQLLHDLPKPYDIDDVSRKYKISREESMNTVLIQEIIRFNRLLSRVLSTLADTGKAIDGLLVMSNELELVYNGLLDNKVPTIWHKVAYPSLKPLGSWMIDFMDRLKFIQKWIDHGPPSSFWISGFFFTQSFLTGVL